MWHEHVWLGRYALPAVVSAAIAWLGLLRDFARRGRLLGSRQSVGLLVLMLGMLGGVTVIAAALLPHAGALPPVVAGVATGAAAVPRRKQEEGTPPYIKFMTLGIALVRERLIDRVHLDARAWSDTFLEGIHSSAQLRVFIYDLKLYLLDRHELSGDVKTVNTLYADAEKALDAALEVQTKIAQDCREPGMPWSREPSEDEAIRERRAFAEARAQCGHLLLFAYIHGRRSEYPQLTALREKATSNDAFHSPRLPPQRSFLSRWRERKQETKP
ncbi:hypothetical protein [Streptomyces sp. NRRL S-1022]|uniref:hypothetical protein n=1 Tax=Streptomyces sp. NRRL S-1022 TaxID=1463880 RepID=UPI0004BFF20A|nr:hypothetical protein [Streptomyces sp. NRRL S-1022]